MSRLLRFAMTILATATLSACATTATVGFGDVHAEAAGDPREDGEAQRHRAELDERERSGVCHSGGCSAITAASNATMTSTAIVQKTM